MSDNLPEVNAALLAWQKSVNEAIKLATSMAGMALQRQAMLNADTAKNKPTQMVSRNGKAYLKYHPHIGPRSGEGPNRGTGNLLKNIRTTTSSSFGGYTAEVGSYASYARALELGNPRWKGGVKYPYLQPAANQMINSGKLRSIFVNTLRAKLGG